MLTKQKILELVEKKKELRSKELTEFFGVSRQYAAGLINELIEEGKLTRIGSTKSAFYIIPGNLPSIGFFQKRLINKNLQEHVVYDEILKKLPQITGLPDNVQSLLDYAFSEMLNNAIEHSRSKNIDVEFNLTKESASFVVNDFGIGVFRNIMKKKKLNSELEAIQDLLKGKLTTQPQAHSGEGIFFTSKAADLFHLKSFEYGLRVDNTIDDTFIEEIDKRKKGTRVDFSISTTTGRHLSDIFKEFQVGQDPAFNKTEVRVKLFTTGDIYMSRSQARRVVVGLDKFETIILDFDRVPVVGQAFVDEIFRVFQSHHPRIKIESVHMKEAVKFMVERGISTSKLDQKNRR